MQLIAEMVDEITEEYDDAEKYAKKAIEFQEHRAKSGPPAEPMMQVYNWEHKKMIDHVARVKALLAMVKM